MTFSWAFTYMVTTICIVYMSLQWQFMKFMKKSMIKNAFIRNYKFKEKYV